MRYKIKIPKKEPKITNCCNENCQSGVINGLNPKLCKKCNPEKKSKQDNCCTPEGQIKRYKDCKGCDRKPKSETLEEAAIEYSIDHTLIGFELSLQKAFLAGANYQKQLMYTEEEVLNILYELHCNNQSERDEVKEWFNQYKK